MHRSPVGSRLHRSGLGAEVCQRILHIGALSLDLDLQQASVAGEPVALSAAEFALVQLLASRPNVAMSKEAILAALQFGPVRLDPRLVDVYVSRARGKLEAVGLSEVIATVCGRGYAVLNANDGCDVVPRCQSGFDPVLVAA